MGGYGARKYWIDRPSISSKEYDRRNWVIHNCPSKSAKIIEIIPYGIRSLKWVRKNTKPPD